MRSVKANVVPMAGTNIVQSRKDVLVGARCQGEYVAKIAKKLGI